MITPAVTHVPCALDQQRRLREARAASLVRARRRRSRRSGGPPPDSVSADLVAGLGARGEDVWTALRV
ncbi:MAG: hypothetical protein ACRDKA_12250 [Actinomycetota bacterium]